MYVALSGIIVWCKSSLAESVHVWMAGAIMNRSMLLSTRHKDLNN